MTIHPPKQERNLDLVIMRQAGMSWSRIAKNHHISIATARRIYDRYLKRKIQQPTGRFGWPGKPEEPRP